MRHLITATCGLITTFFLADPAYSQARTAPGAQKAHAAIASIRTELSEAFSVIEKNYAGTKELVTNEIFGSSIKWMLLTLDPHSHYDDPDESKKEMAKIQSKYFGIGAGITSLFDKYGDAVATYVTQTFARSAARSAGLKYGDKVIAVDGKSMLGKPSDEVREFLLGDEGTTVTVTLERLDSGKQETFTLVRGAVPQPSVSDAYIIRPGIGYIAARTRFTATTHFEFEAKLKELKALGMRQLVVDLRDNGGGVVDAAAQVARYFLYKGQMIYGDQTRGRTLIVDGDNRSPETMPLVVLVNGATASSSEILTGALQDHDRAIVVGETTFGKGLQQWGHQLPNGGLLWLTNKRSLTPSWRIIQRNYTHTGLYDYYMRRTGRPEWVDTTKPPRPAFKTDIGRTVYGDGGVDPDVISAPEVTSPDSLLRQSKLIDPVLDFTLELTSGRVRGLESYKVGPIDLTHTVTNDDYPVTDALIASFKSFAAGKYGTNAASVDAERSFVAQRLRYLMILAAYGQTNATRVTDEADLQIKRGIAALPDAERLAKERSKYAPVYEPPTRKKPRKR